MTGLGKEWDDKTRTTNPWLPPRMNHDLLTHTEPNSDTPVNTLKTMAQIRAKQGQTTHGKVESSRFKPFSCPWLGRTPAQHIRNNYAEGLEVTKQ